MDELWEFVTPTHEGIKTTRMFYEAVQKYIEIKGLNAVCYYCDIPEKVEMRAGIESVENFLKEAMKKDSPVAFLNLCNGQETDLERWHWVTIISIEAHENLGGLFAMILDEGKIKRINLGLWHETTKLGGGFV